MCNRVQLCFFFQAEDGIRDLVRSRGLGDVYKRQGYTDVVCCRNNPVCNGEDDPLGVKNQSIIIWDKLSRFFLSRLLPFQILKHPSILFSKIGHICKRPCNG